MFVQVYMKNALNTEELYYDETYLHQVKVSDFNASFSSINDLWDHHLIGFVNYYDAVLANTTFNSENEVDVSATKVYGNTYTFDNMTFTFNGEC